MSNKMSADEAVLKWKQIEALDLSEIKRKLQSKKGLWWRFRNNVDKLELEYKQFLYLIAINPGEVVVPWSQNMDDLWHEHILDTVKYSQDCQDIFGRYIHHNPHLGLGTSNQQYHYEKTKKIYKETFEDKAKKKKSGDSSFHETPGCSAIMPVVFCGATPDSASSNHSSSSCSSNTSSCSSNSSSCGSSSCGSAGCGGGGCGGGGD